MFSLYPAFFNVFFQETKRRKVDACVYGAHWNCVFFSGIYAKLKDKRSEARSTARKISLCHHVSNHDDTYPVCLYSTRHESFVI